MEFQELRQRIFTVSGPREFNALAIDIFHYQYERLPIYRQFVDGLHTDVQRISELKQIPFLPISFFKSHRMILNGLDEQLVFESSGTTGMNSSRHYVADFNLYEESFSRSFRLFFGDLSQYCIFALLPSYLERGNSSLVYMVERMRWKSDQSFGGFYLHELAQLADSLNKAAREGKKIILFGVTYALLDLAEQFPLKLPDLIIFETGGMKGRKKEITRMELHHLLCEGFGVERIYSEYGMTELLSQAWSRGDGIFDCPPWMNILIRDPNDPLEMLDNGKAGGINVIDLANLYSCSFIATQDLGKKVGENSFEVLGRFDDSDIRGCSLLVS